MERLKESMLHRYGVRLLPLIGLFILMAAAREPGSGTVSGLWGVDGGSWTPRSRLPDFSFAGYGAGLKRIPRLPVKANVRSFGAAGDGVSDDTEAFNKAIAAVRRGAVLIPAGRYRITGVLRVRRSGIVLRGEGSDKTILLFPRSLTEMAGPGEKRAPGGSWSWSGGAISFEGGDSAPRLARVISPAKRGDRSLAVSTTDGLAPGQWVRLLLVNADGSLSRHLYGGREDTPAGTRREVLVDFVSPVKAVTGGRIVLQRPLRTDVLPGWEPEIREHRPSVQDVGVEQLSIIFPPGPYAGHLKEPGYNAITFDGVSNGWVRQVQIVNADSGVILRGQTKFCTVESVQFTADPVRLSTRYGRPRVPVGGHHGILLTNAQDNLVSDFRFTYRFVHDLSVSAWAAGNVFSGGTGVDLNIDHHRRGPYENLFTEIQAGEGTRLWDAGGDTGDGAPSGVRETFWNIRTDLPQQTPSWALEGNFVGVTTLLPSKRAEDGDWWEAIPPEQLFPANLYQTQRRHVSFR